MSADKRRIISKETELKKLEEQKRILVEGLPHLYGFKHYSWSRQVFESFAKVIFLSAANQVGKSSVGIRKCIHWSTDPRCWAKISRKPKPSLFFYFYPSLKLARREIDHKWIPEFLPRGEFKDHPVYGWKLIDDKDKLSIKFNSGIEVQFLGYSQGKADLLALAASSPDAIFIDEEMDPDLWPEVSMRVEATKGCIMFLATPVHCYPFYKEIFEGRTKLEGALIRTISMYECVKFEDGSPGLYTVADCKKREQTLGSQSEIDKRVHGKYASPEGLEYQSFARERNVKPTSQVPDNWCWYAAIDPGSGGQGHPAAIAFVAVSPDFRKARVVHCWRGKPGEQTPNPVIVTKFLELKRALMGDKPLFGAYYDWASKDFHLVAQTAGIGYLQKANKDRTFGKDLINSLFKNEMLDIDDTEPNQDLIQELENLRTDTLKRHAKDDAIDATRYCVSSIPFDFSFITVDLLKPVNPPKERVLTQDDLRRGSITESTHLLDEAEEDIEIWNSLMED